MVPSTKKGKKFSLAHSHSLAFFFFLFVIVMLHQAARYCGAAYYPSKPLLLPSNDEFETDISSSAATRSHFH
jgi:hypothetical protein